MGLNRTVIVGLRENRDDGLIASIAGGPQRHGSVRIRLISRQSLHEPDQDHAGLRFATAKGPAGLTQNGGVVSSESRDGPDFVP